MLPPLVLLEDAEARLGKVFDLDEQERPLAVLADASALVRAEAGRTWVDDTGEVADVPDVVAAVVLRVAIRAIEHPEGFVSESGGDYTYTRRGVEDGVYLTDREERMIRRAVGRSGLWTQPVERGDIAVSNTGWVDDQYGLEPFPLDVYPRGW